MKRPAGYCLFCNEAKDLTYEHVFSKWIQEHVPRGHNKAMHMVRRLEFDSATDAWNSFENDRTMAGDPLSNSLKIVCTECNTRWMSRIVNRARPHLSRLFGGTWGVMTAKACKEISAWAALTTMVWEQADPRTAAISREDHSYILTHEIAPPRWRVWLGTSGEPLATGGWHTGLSIYDSYRTPPPEECNTQTHLIIIGKVVIQTASSSQFRSIQFLRYAKDSPLTSIWPLRKTPVDRPSRRVIDDDIPLFNEHILASFASEVA